MTPTRRDLLGLVLASAAGAALPSIGSSQTKVRDYPFALGVASGSPAADGMVLWTRLATSDFVRPFDAQAYPVRWEIALDENFQRIVQSGNATASPELGHSVHVEVRGLPSDTWFWYRFMLGDAISPTGRTRSFPAADAPKDRMRFAYASCQRWEHGYFNAYRHMAEENLDAVIFLGDYIYEYAGAKNPVRPHSLGVADTLDGYRQRYALYKTDPDLQRMHAAAPWLVVWDDHEVQNDYANETSEDLSPNFPARRIAAYQAYYENMPLRASTLLRGRAGLNNSSAMRIYGRVPFGRLAMFHLLDDRQYRDVEVCPKPNRGGSNIIDPKACPDLADPRRTMLGAEQERWLDDGLAQQRTGEGQTWNVLAMQTLFSQRDLQRSNGDPRFWTDGWDGYPAARARLSQSIAGRRPSNPIMVGGDVHENWVCNVKLDFDDVRSPVIATEFCGTSISSRSNRTNVDDILRGNPHVVFADSAARGYGVVDITPGSLVASLRGINSVVRPHSTISTLASFTAEDGWPGIA